ncbi:acylphosphatase [Paradesertivirga mongoliensis]|uniref:Acylphosphatase n=1 Tax=Paradesertivirga mongoliensis TaxID=2100740 RepID=A0ABW4ZIZ2_9SPHI|nr:acylphosphatase [Pedobacter mongoliensis]
MKHLNIVVGGKVQGVSFRISTKAVADQLSVKGFVKNTPDGSVYIEAEGDDFSLESFLEWCHEGPLQASVQKVEVVEGEVKNYRNFEILKK